MDQRNCCVVIPTLNEAESIKDLVEFFTFNNLYVIVVDDNSSDETRELAHYAGAYVIHNTERKGLNRSLWQGINLALENSFDYIATVDAGRSHDPNHLFVMLNFMNDYDLVIGSRFLPFSEYENSKGKWYRPYLSKLAAKLCNLAQHGSNYTDWTSGYRVYRSSLLNSLKRFSYNAKMHPVQIEMLGRATQLGAKVIEYPISYIAGKTSFNKSVANETFKIWLQLLNHYPAKPKYVESELV